MLNQIRSQLLKPLLMTVGATIFNGEVMTLDITHLGQAPLYWNNIWPHRFKRLNSENAYNSRSDLLSLSRQRPQRRSTDKRNELSRLHFSPPFAAVECRETNSYHRSLHRFAALQ
jgi:hypothetical protein